MPSPMGERHSVPSGVKPTFLAEHGHEVLKSASPDDDFDETVRIAQQEYDDGHPDVIVGSSRCGAVAVNIESGDAGPAVTAVCKRKASKTLKNRGFEAVFPSGEGGIRTLGTREGTLVFETSTIGHSVTSPGR